MALTEAALTAFLRDTLNLEEVAPDTELFSSGALDSVAMLTLITFIEEAAGIQVRPDQVTLENLDSPARILDFAASEAA